MNPLFTVGSGLCKQFLQWRCRGKNGHCVSTVNRHEDSYLHLSQNSTRSNSIQFSISSSPGRQSLVISAGGLSCSNKIFLVEKLLAVFSFSAYLANLMNFVFGKDLFERSLKKPAFPWTLEFHPNYNCKWHLLAYAVPTSECTICLIVHGIWSFIGTYLHFGYSNWNMLWSFRFRLHFILWSCFLPTVRSMYFWHPFRQKRTICSVSDQSVAIDNSFSSVLEYIVNVFVVDPG